MKCPECSDTLSANEAIGATLFDCKTCGLAYAVSGKAMSAWRALGDGQRLRAIHLANLREPHAAVTLTDIEAALDNSDELS